MYQQNGKQEAAALFLHRPLREREARQYGTWWSQTSGKSATASAATVVLSFTQHDHMRSCMDDREGNVGATFVIHTTVKMVVTLEISKVARRT